MTIHIAPQRQTDQAWDKAERQFAELLTTLGYGPESSEHLADTPRRFIGMLRELFHDEPWEFTMFEKPAASIGGEGDVGIVVIKDITFTSLCAHHFAPFFGKAHVAYIPYQRVPGLSKIARTVQSFSKGPNVQELITSNIADFLTQQLDPLGVYVITQAEHTCMTHRGAKAHGSSTMVSAIRGVFVDSARARQEALTLLTTKEL